MQRYEKLDKKILNFILEEEIPFEKIEDVFYELYLINPHSKDESLDELTLYPKSYFHSKDVCQAIISELTSLLKSNKKFISRKRFRAFLALIYLKGMKEKPFKGSKKLLKITENQEPFALAYKVFYSEDFKATFTECDAILVQNDGIIENL